MNEKSLNSFLAMAIRNKQVPLDLSDAFVDRFLELPVTAVSAAFSRSVKSRLQTRIQDAAVVEARKSIVPTEIPFGQFIATVREKAGLSRAAVAQRLKKTEDFVERLERGHIDPVKLAVREFADIVEFFRVNYRFLGSMLAVSMDAANAKRGLTAIARSHGGKTNSQRGEDVERALEAFARTIHASASLEPPKTVSDEARKSLLKLESELRRRGRTDLIS